MKKLALTLFFLLFILPGCISKNKIVDENTWIPFLHKGSEAEFIIVSSAYASIKGYTNISIAWTIKNTGKEMFVFSNDYILMKEGDDLHIPTVGKIDTYTQAGCKQYSDIEVYTDGTVTGIATYGFYHTVNTKNLMISIRGNEKKIKILLQPVCITDNILQKLNQR